MQITRQSIGRSDRENIVTFNQIASVSNHRLKLTAHLAKILSARSLA